MVGIIYYNYNKIIIINDCFITSEVKSFQKSIVSKNEQKIQLQTMLEKKEERVRELVSQIKRKNKMLQNC